MLVPDLRTCQGRWPGFAPAAIERGTDAVFAFPLQLGAVRFGVLTCVRAEAGPLGKRELSAGLIFAEVATELLLDSSPTGDNPDPQLHAAMHAHDEVYQAQGMVMVDLAVPLDVALARMRAMAFAEGISLQDLSADIVAGRRSSEGRTTHDSTSPDILHHSAANRPSRPGEGDTGMISTEHLSDLFVDVADTLVADFDVVDFLTTLCEHATIVSGADAVGIMLTDHRGDLRFMAASNDAGRNLELAPAATRGGPLPGLRSHQGAGGQHRPRGSAQLARVRAATPSKPASTPCTPSRCGSANRPSARSTCSASPRSRFDPGEVRVVQSLADVATIAILQERSIARAEALTEQLQGALNSRVVIEQAKGALARIEGITVDEAFVRLRERARSSRQRLVDVAATVLSDS